MKEQKEEKTVKTEFQVMDRGVDLDKGTTATACCTRSLAKINP